MSNPQLSYAQNFVSFLFQELDEKIMQNVKEIILFGSSSRGDATKKSDVDIFINLYRNDKKIENPISKIKNNFYASVFVKKYWKLISVENEINCVIGKLDEWKDLKTSIIADGVVLYAKYEGKNKTKGKNNVLIYWGKITPESKRVYLSKKLFGYNYNKKRHKGVVEDTKAIKLGSNCLFVPIDDVNIVLQQFKDAKVPFRTIYVNKI